MKDNLLNLIQSKDMMQFLSIIGLILIISVLCVGIVSFLKNHRHIKQEDFDQYTASVEENERIISLLENNFAKISNYCKFFLNCIQ